MQKHSVQQPAAPQSGFVHLIVAAITKMTPVAAIISWLGVRLTFSRDVGMLDAIIAVTLLCGLLIVVALWISTRQSRNARKQSQLTAAFYRARQQRQSDRFQ